jgi:hypothetical protein
MAFKEILEKMRGNDTKDRVNDLVREMRVQKLAEERFKSSNERMLEKDLEELRQKDIKSQLEMVEKRRSSDINYGHNPLNIPNIMNKKGWEVMKERNMFSNNKNMFAHQKNIMKGNPNLLNNGNLGLVR